MTLKPVEHVPKASHAPVAGQFERQAVITSFCTTELHRRSSERIISGEMEPDASARCPPLQLGRRAFCYRGTTVDEDHTVCQAIRFFQVLRRQQDGHPVGDQVSDGLPENLSPTWIEASRWLVQEDDPGLAHEGHRKIETTAHTSE